MSMRWRRPAATATFLAAALLSLVSAISAQNAQNAESFKVRLSPVPISVAMMSTIAGYGSLTATLKGKQLTIQGTFEGLRSPATTVQIHRGPKGIPGPAIAEFKFDGDEGGEGRGQRHARADAGSDCRPAQRPPVRANSIRARARWKFVGLAFEVMMHVLRRAAFQVDVLRRA